MAAPEKDSPLVRNFVASPNHGARAAGARIDCILLHYTGLREDALEAWTCDPGGEALRWLCAPQSQVSCHYMVERDGTIIQLVCEARRAWHAGRGAWKDCADINSCSIGVEIVNVGHAGGLPPYPDAQIEAVIALCKDISARHKIPAARILAHSDVAPDRKADPGEHFPWDRLARAGVGHFVDEAAKRDGPRLSPDAEGEEVAALQAQLAAYGYNIKRSGVYDAATTQSVRAFQRHFRRSLVDGAADASTRETLKRLIAALPASSDHSAAARAKASGS